MQESEEEEDEFYSEDEQDSDSGQPTNKRRRTVVGGAWLDLHVCYIIQCIVNQIFCSVQGLNFCSDPVGEGDYMCI